MKKTFSIFLMILAMAGLIQADFLGIFSDGTTSPEDSVWVYVSMWDSLALKFETPDTLYILRYNPGGNTISADTITSPGPLTFADGFYMKRYRAGDASGQYTVHAWAANNGNYYSLANHCYFVQEKSASLVDSAGIYRAVLSALMADSAEVDTGNGSFAHAAVSDVVLPDSLLEVATKVDTIYIAVGRAGVSGSEVSLHMKLGDYDGSAGTGNVEDHLDSISAYVGKHDVSIEGIVSLHNKLGLYDGTSGPGNNIKEDFERVTGSSSGSEPETLLVFCLADTSRIQGAQVTVRTVDQSTVKVIGMTTDVNGCLLMSLNPEDYWVDAFAQGYNPAYDTLTVAIGGGTDSLFLARFNPGSPPIPGLCRVYGWVYDISGDSLGGIAITAEIPREYHPVKYQNVVITPFSKSTATDSTGYWQIDLIPSALLSVADIEYLFTLNYESGVIYRVRVIVPQEPSWQLQ